MYEPDFTFLVSLGENFAEVSPVFPHVDIPDQSKDDIDKYIDIYVK